MELSSGFLLWPLEAFFFVGLSLGVVSGLISLWVSCFCGFIGLVRVWVPVCPVPGFCAPHVYLYACTGRDGERESGNDLAAGLG